MKRTNLLLTVCASAFLFASCQSEEDVLSNASNESLSTRAMVDENAPYYVGEDGALNFKSSEDYFALCDSLAQLDEDAYHAWEQEMHFESYRSYTDKMIDEVNAAWEENDEQKATALLQKYSNYIYMNADSTVWPVIMSRTYQNVTNKDGVFYVNGAKNVVDAQYVTLASSKGRSIHRIAYFNPFESATRATESAPLKKLVYIKSDGSKLVEAIFSILKNTAFSDSHGANMTMLQAEVNINGKKKKRGKWRDYTTTYALENLHGIFNGIPQSTTSEGYATDFKQVYLDLAPERVELGKGVRGIYTGNLMKFAAKNLTQPVQKPTCVHFKAITGGTNLEGVGYNYYNGSYFEPTDKCVPGSTNICPQHQNVYSRDN